MSSCEYFRFYSPEAETLARLYHRID